MSYIKLTVFGSKKAGVSVQTVNGQRVVCIHAHKTPATVGGGFPLLSTTNRQWTAYASNPDAGINHHGSLFVYRYAAADSDFILNERFAIRYAKVFFETEEVTLGWPVNNSRTPRRASATAVASNASFNANGNITWLAAGYTTDHIFRGYNSYGHDHNSDAMNTPINGVNGYRIGVELEVEFENNSQRIRFAQQSSNWFKCKRDGSLSSDGGCEIVTIPLMPADARSPQFWQPLCQQLTDLGATSWNNGRCGLHVHIGREILGDGDFDRQASIGRIYGMYESFSDRDLAKVFGREYGHWCKKTDTEHDSFVKNNNLLKEKSGSAMYAQVKKAADCGDRYRAINTTPAPTIEFRQGRGSLNADRIIGIVEFTSHMAEYCSDIRNAINRASFVEYLKNKNVSRWLLKQLGAVTESEDR